MNKKQWLIFGFLVAFVIGVVLFFIQQQKIASVQNQNSKYLDVELLKQGQDYPQYIEAISGNTDEVWYNIPELGVRMKLNKEFAEDLIYKYYKHKDSDGKEWDAAYFSTKTLTNIDKGCSPEEGSPFGVVTKNKGDINELVKDDNFYTSRLNNIRQIGVYYYMWTGPQATCWNPKHDTEVARVRSSETYINIQTGIKNLEMIPLQ